MSVVEARPAPRWSAARPIWIAGIASTHPERGASTAPLHGMAVVGVHVPPVVVRTDPVPQKVDVPLNAVMTVVFSEPIDATTLTPTSVQLLRDTVPVRGTLRLVSSGLEAVFERVKPVLLALGGNPLFVGSQAGQASALDIADALIAIATRMKDDASPALRGVFHMTGSGEATWADLAETVFHEAAARGRRLTQVKRIATADYPTPARRPANSRLDNEKLARVYGVRLPEWRQSVEGCCDRLLS